MSGTPTPLAGLRGLRLALYDEALTAGPRGLTAPELRNATYEEAQRMGLRPEAHAEDVRWLLEHKLLAEYQPGRYRARGREEAVALWNGTPTAARQTEDRGQKTEDSERKRPQAATTQLRTPLFAPRQRRDGQGTFF